MSEVKSRSIRLDDENWEWISKLPGRTQNEAVSALRDSQPEDTRLDEVLQFVRSAPSEMEEATLRAIARWKNERHAPLTGAERAFAEGGAFAPYPTATGAAIAHEQSEAMRHSDPRTIPGVSVGVPPKVEGQFPCRCTHSGCHGAKFMGTSRFQTLCDECRESGHLGDPRNCERCFEDKGPV